MSVTAVFPSPTLKRVLVVTRNLPPLIGGMERLNWCMARELARYAQVRAIGPIGSRQLAPPGVEIDEAALRPLWRFIAHSGWAAILQARRWRPHVVLAGSALTAPIAFAAARSCGAEAAVYAHGLDLAVPSIAYRSLWLPVVKHMDKVIVNSNATHELAIAAGTLPERISLVHPGTSIQDTGPTADAVTSWRAQWVTGDSPLLLSVGRLTERKGLRQFVLGVMPKIVAKHPNATLVIIGDAATNSLHAKSQSREAIMAAAKEARIERNIRFNGWVSDDDTLQAAYRAADLHVFPVRHLPNDPEGFGMVSIEAAAHGLATVAYRTGGVADAVEDGVSGTLVTPHDEDAFASASLALIDRPLSRAAVIRHAQKFSWDRIGLQLAQVLLGASV